MTCVMRFLILSAALASTSADAGQVDLTMTGFASDSGRARIVLMEGNEAYSGHRPVTHTASVPIKHGRAMWSGSVAPGTYAIIAHHDKNANDALDRPIFGLPVEPYGFSNGTWTSIGLPAFDDVAFDIGTGVAPQRITMRTNAFVTIAQIAATGAAALMALFALAAVGRRRAHRPIQKGIFL